MMGMSNQRSLHRKCPAGQTGADDGDEEYGGEFQWRVSSHSVPTATRYPRISASSGYSKPWCQGVQPECYPLAITCVLRALTPDWLLPVTGFRRARNPTE